MLTATLNKLTCIFRVHKSIVIPDVSVTLVGSAINRDIFSSIARSARPACRGCLPLTSQLKSPNRMSFHWMLTQAYLSGQTVIQLQSTGDGTSYILE